MPESKLRLSGWCLVDYLGPCPLELKVEDFILNSRSSISDRYHRSSCLSFFYGFCDCTLLTPACSNTLSCVWWSSIDLSACSFLYIKLRFITTFLCEWKCKRYCSICSWNSICHVSSTWHWVCNRIFILVDWVNKFFVEHCCLCSFVECWLELSPAWWGWHNSLTGWWLSVSSSVTQVHCLTWCCAIELVHSWHWLWCHWSRWNPGWSWFPKPCALDLSELLLQLFLVLYLDLLCFCLNLSLNFCGNLLLNFLWQIL